MSDASAFGNLVDLKAGEILLPPFMQRHDDGLYVNLAAFDTGRPFAQFAERVFAAGARFADLDYAAFLDLVFLWEPRDIDAALADYERHGKPPLLRIARDVVAFPAERRDIYRNLKIAADGSSAEYIFEPVSIEHVETDPNAPDGMRVTMERLHPDFDEFVAALWVKGLRFGIDAKAVRDAIARDLATRMTIAAGKAPLEGKDAGIDEQTDLLHRDDAPRLLPNGRMDLRHYRNRFPQVAAGTRLFKKVPRVLGRSGWNVAGKELPPQPVKDFELDALVGAGAQLLRDASGEYIVAAQNGFLDIDAQSGQISVVDKIVSREGVSMRTTGDLALSGDDYEEHGEVQEKRKVEGHNMTFCAAVFGEILSDGGRVTLKQSLSGGSVTSPNGTIAVEGNASRAVVEARGGEVVLARAESCTIVAERVSVGQAVNCDIVAGQVTIEQAAGCTIAGRSVAVTATTSRRDETTRVIMLLPDLVPFDYQRQALESARADAGVKLEQLTAALQALRGQADMKTYAAMAPRIKSGTVALTPAQRSQWDALVARATPALRKAVAIEQEVRKLRERVAGSEEELAAVAQARRDAIKGIACRVETVGGETQVFARRPVLGEAALEKLPLKPLHKRLHELGGDAERLFAGRDGSFEWQATTPED